MRTILFKINGKNLYREINLITLAVPAFFVCKDDEGKRYLVWYTDFFADEYIIYPIANERLLLMLSGKLSLRDLYEESEFIYLVAAGDDINNDVITKVKYKELNKCGFSEDSFFIINKYNEDELKDYINILNNEVSA